MIIFHQPSGLDPLLQLSKIFILDKSIAATLADQRYNRRKKLS
jgi:hypothetical protein